MRDWGPHCFASSEVQRGQSLTQFSYQNPQGTKKAPALPVSIPLRDVRRTSVGIVAFKTGFCFFFFHEESPYGSHYSVGPEAICANPPDTHTHTHCRVELNHATFQSGSLFTS